MTELKNWKHVKLARPDANFYKIQSAFVCTQGGYCPFFSVYPHPRGRVRTRPTSIIIREQFSYKLHDDAAFNSESIARVYC